MHVGDIVGRLNAYGYVHIKVDSKMYLAHQLAWLYSYGVWPTGPIDHINGVRNDNRLINLRECAASQNQQNIRKARSHNELGVLGVHQQYNRFGAIITSEGKKYWLGTISTVELAHEAYLSAKRKLHEFGSLQG